MSKWFDLFWAAQAFVGKEDGSVVALKAAIKAFSESKIEIVRDSMAGGITDEAVKAFVAEHMPLAMTMSSRSFHYRDGRTDAIIWVDGFGPYLDGQIEYEENEDGKEVSTGTALTSADDPGTWICYHLEEVRIHVYGPGFRIVTVTMYLSPQHDSHARFGPAVYEAFCRLES